MEKYSISHNNILLDVGDTLVSINEQFEHYTRCAIRNMHPYYVEKESNIKLFEEVVLGIRNNIRAHAHETLYEYSFTDFIQKIDKHYKINNSKKYDAIEALYISAELDITILKEGVHQFLKIGKQKNKRFIIATNNFSRMHVFSIIDVFELSQYIDHVFISGEMKVRKPSIEFINIICDSLSLRKEETIIIGDKQDMDIKAADLSGIDSCLINTICRNDKSMPTYFVNSLDQLILI